MEGGRVLLKAKGKGSKRWYRPPGKYLRGDETLEVAVSNGFERDTGGRCAVKDLAYVIESFREDNERELGIYFSVSAPALLARKKLGRGLLLVQVEKMASMRMRPRVLGGKVIADEKRGSHGSATYLVSEWKD